MGLFKIGARCCNNCIHWECHSERKIRGNPPKEVYTTSNCDKCSQTNRSTLSKDCCAMFSHIGGVSTTFPLDQGKDSCNAGGSSIIDFDPGEAFLNSVVEDIKERRAVQSSTHNASEEDESTIDPDGEAERAFAKAMAEKKKAKDRILELIREGLDPRHMDDSEAVDFMHMLDRAKSGEPKEQYAFANALWDGTHGAIGAESLSAQNKSGMPVEWCRKAANGGLADAQYHIGHLGWDGERKSIGWLRMAAENGHAGAKKELITLSDSLIGNAKDLLGQCINLLNSKIEGDITQVLSLIRAASKELKHEWSETVPLHELDPEFTNVFVEKIEQIATGGNYEMQNAVGKLYGAFSGYSNIVKQNDEMAVQWFQKAAERGCLDAMDNLGVCFCNGEGVEKDANAGIEWYRKAAEGGLDWGQYHYACRLISGEGVEKDIEQAKLWLEKAAAQGMKKACARLSALDDELESSINPCSAIRAGWRLYKEENYDEAVRYFKIAEEAGFAGSSYPLGICYYLGRGVAEDEKKALELFRDSIDKFVGEDYVDACDRLARFYEKGKVTEMSSSVALKFYQRAARCACGGEWNPYTAEKIGEWFLNGENGVDKDIGKAVYWLQHAQWMSGSSEIKELLERAKATLNSEGGDTELAELIEEVGDDFKLAYSGDADAQLKIGNRYSRGEGVDEKDGSAALFWWYKSAEAGNAQAQHLVGRAYYFGRNAAKNYAEAVNWFRKAAVQGSTAAKLFLGTCYRNGRGVEKDLEKAFGFYSEAAESQREAMFWVGRFHEKGWGGAEKNSSTAFEWYQKAAEEGSTDAICAVGWAYQRGDGVDADLAKAAEWFGKGADKGDGVCANNLARLYEDGKGVEKDLAMALSLFEKAAENKCVRANYHLGRFHENGLGTATDVEKAKQYYQKAADSDDADAKDALARLNA